MFSFPKRILEATKDCEGHSNVQSLWTETTKMDHLRVFVQENNGEPHSKCGYVVARVYFSQCTYSQAN